MESSEFRALPQKKKLALIAEMRREAEAAITEVWSSFPETYDKEIAKYAELHRIMRQAILNPEPYDEKSSQFPSPLVRAYLNLSHAYRVALSMQEKYKNGQLTDQQQEKPKNKGGRPKVGEKKGITVRMPDDEWVPVRAAINYYQYTDAEFFAEAAKLLAAQRTASMDPDQIRLYGGKGSGS